MPLLSPKRWRMQPVRLPNLYGELYLPPACPEQSPDAVPINSPTFHEEVGRFTRPRPGLVVAPSSAGICDVRERHYARYFSDAGFVCLVVDCFTPPRPETMRGRPEQAVRQRDEQGPSGRLEPSGRKS